MKIIKGILYSIAAFLVLCCVAVLICAMNPKLTEELAKRVQQLQPETAAGTQTVPGLRPDWRQEGADSYVVPETGSVQTPKAVGGLTGYQPVADRREELAIEEADNLSSILSVGNTGSDLSFSEELYPYYGMLSEQLKPVYLQIYANACELLTSFAPVTEVDVNSLKSVFEAVCNDHPELFWLETGYSCKYAGNGRCIEIVLQYNDTADRLEDAREKWDSSAESILAAARALSGDLEKEKYVHDVLLRLVRYDAAAKMGQSAYSAMVEGESVCAGYARAFQYLLQQLGIPCYYCTGYSGQNHAWNIVKLDGVYRNVDVTWDDTEPSTQDYFNRTDAEFAKTHVRTGLSVYLPACGGTQAAEGQSGEGVAATPHPTPMIWTGKPDSNKGGDDKDADKKEAGVTDEEIMETLEEYYKNCAEQLVKKGTGQVQFQNVVPEKLWSTVEKAYSDGSYRKGYVDAALEQLKVEDFAIQLQVQRLGGGYYRLYHNVYTGKLEELRN